MNINDLADGLACLGNSLLKPMNLSSDAGLDPRVWEGFLTLGSDALSDAARECGGYVSSLVEQVGREQAALECSAEHTRLFVGPRKPEAAPWETMYRPGANEETCGFGQATTEMRALLRSEGLGLSNENNQYEDHMGVELLLLSHLLRKAAVCETGDAQAAMSKVRGFAAQYPGRWIGAFRDRVSAAAPGGYFDHLLAVAQEAIVLVGAL